MFYFQPIFRKNHELSEPAGVDEPNIISVKIVPGDTPQEVVEKILDQV